MECKELRLLLGLELEMELEPEVNLDVVLELELDLDFEIVGDRSSDSNENKPADTAISLLPVDRKEEVPVDVGAKPDSRARVSSAVISEDANDDEDNDDNDDGDEKKDDVENVFEDVEDDEKIAFCEDFSLVVDLTDADFTGIEDVDMVDEFSEKAE
jgi:hypothetical protein